MNTDDVACVIDAASRLHDTAVQRPPLEETVTFMTRRIGPKCVLSALVCATALATAPTAHAESGRLNLHLDLGVGIPLAGERAPNFSAGVAQTIPIGPAGTVGLDWQIAAPVAIELLVGGGYILPTPSVPNGTPMFNAALGARLRFLDNQEGYLNEQGGDALGNFWVSAHVGYHLFDGNQLGVDVGTGYEWSVFKPLQLGVFARGAVLFDFVPNQYTDFVLTLGASLSIELMGRPPAVDTDKDGLSDEREIERWRTDPRNPDTDGDGINDGLEVKTHTNPVLADTDGDGLKDGAEDANHDGMVSEGESDPRESDTDHGGVSDGWEAEHRPHDLRDPKDDDADGDHVLDDHDACLGTPPNTEVDARGCAVLKQELVLEGITFEFNSAVIQPASETTLQGAAEILNENPSVKVEIAGYTDNVGSASFNLQLSQARAQAVHDWLASHGVNPARLSVKGYGPARPRASNDTEEGRAQNRRIEFHRKD